MKKIVVLLLIAICMVNMDSFSQKNKKREKFDPVVKEQILNKKYKLKALRALPQGWKSVSLDGRYFLEIKGDSIISYLPYYGRAYSIPYGGGDGLDFKGAIQEYEIEEGKKNRLDIDIETRSREDSYTFKIQIYPNGSANISVSSNNRQSISYIAELEIDN